LLTCSHPNGIADLPDEDIDRENVVKAAACRAPGGAYDPVGPKRS
jgi:hypothetical protein